MRFSVVRMRRRGVPIAKERLARESAVSGELLVGEHADAALGRTTRLAQLKDTGQPIGGDLLPALHDVQLLWVAPLGLTLAGFERITVGSVTTDYAQSWWCRGV